MQLNRSLLIKNLPRVVLRTRITLCSVHSRNPVGNCCKAHVGKANNDILNNTSNTKGLQKFVISKKLIVAFHLKGTAGSPIKVIADMFATHFQTECRSIIISVYAIDVIVMNDDLIYVNIFHAFQRKWF